MTYFVGEIIQGSQYSPVEIDTKNEEPGIFHNRPFLASNCSVACPKS